MNRSTVKSLILEDWAPHIEKTVRLIAVPIAAAYVAGLMFGEWLHQLNDALAALVVTKPRNPAADFLAALEDPGPIPVKVQHCRPVAASCGIAPQTPMDRAILMVQAGHSQAAAARRYNVSRSTLRRRLKG